MNPLARFSLLVVWVVGPAACAGSPGTSAADRPNIILAMADDQGWGDMAYNGHPVLKTPVFDEMARVGLRFDRFYAAAPVCSPTRGSVLTGRHPNRFGVFRWGHSIRPQETTVAEALRTAGYATGHFGKWHLGSIRADSGASPGQNGFDEWFSAPNFFENSPLMSHNGKVVETKGEGSKVTVEAALRWMRTISESDKPFLAVVWFGSPHGPHIAVEEDLETYKDQTKAQQNFLGEITAMDRAMGILRREIRKMGIARNTLLWYTSDNGAIRQGSTGGLKGRKGSIWEGGLRVPALIEWPARAPSPRTLDVNAGTVDIYPTLLEIAGVTMENQPPLDGISLLPLIKGRTTRRDAPLGFWSYPARGRSMKSRALLQELMEEQAAGKQRTPGDAGEPDPADLSKQYPKDVLPGHAAWLDGDYKLHRIVARNGKVAYSLFNLRTDAAETTDLLAKQPERVKRMKAQLDAWQKSVIDSLNGADYSGK